MSLWSTNPIEPAVASPSSVLELCITANPVWDWHLTTLACLTVVGGYNAWLVRNELRDIWIMKYALLRRGLMRLGMGIGISCFAASLPTSRRTAPVPTRHDLHPMQLQENVTDDVVIDIED